ncbi:PQQ-binding-like beta-propeller repeat protein [Bacteroidota bacterium]
MTDKKMYKINTRLWKKIAVIAAVFAFIICILLIANYLQLNKLDPLNTESVNTLVERLNENPQDDILRNEIRSLDLLVRKAYFTNQWQIRMGGYLLLASIAVLIIAFQILNSAKKIEPKISEGEGENYLIIQKNARKWISIGGGAIVIVALVFAFLSHNELSEKFTRAASSDNEQIVGNEEHGPEPASAKAVIDKPEISVEKSVGEQEKTPVEDVEKTPAEVEETAKQKIEDPEPITNTESLASASNEPDKTKNFPSFRGHSGNGIVYQTNFPESWDGTSGDNILWKKAIPVHGYNSPIIWENKVFLSGANATERFIYCFNGDNGEIIWNEKVDNIPGSPDKAPDVTNDTGHAAPTMTTDGSRVYAIFSNGDIVGVDMEGNRVWGRNLGMPDNHYGHSSSLIMYKNIVIVQYDHGRSSTILGLSAETGETVWSTDRDVKISWASPIVVFTGNRTEIITVADPFVISYDPATGKELWRIDCIFGEVGPSAAYADGIVFVMNEYATLSAIKIGDKPELLWEDDEYLSDIPSPVATKDYLIIPTSWGMIACYNPKTGEKYWEQEYEDGFYSSPVIVNDKVYILNREGVMHIFNLDKEYILIGEPKLGEVAYSTPAFANGRIYIRSNNNLFCIGK